MSKFFYKIDVPENKMNGTQYVLARDSEFGLWRNLLGEDSLTLHQLAARIKKYVERYTEYEMPTENRLGFGLLRLVQEGLIGMSGQEQGPLIKFKKLHEDAKLPSYQTAGAAGADVYSVENCTISPGETKVVKLGFSIEIEKGWEVQVRSRSGLAAKNSVFVLNSPGTIDEDYRGENMVILHNAGLKPFVVDVGDRIAQLVVNRATQAVFSEAEELTDTARGVGGFGSTGVK